MKVEIWATVAVSINEIGNVKVSERKSPIEVIGAALPTFAECYKNPTEVKLPGRSDLDSAASRIVGELKAAGWNIT